MDTKATFPDQTYKYGFHKPEHYVFKSKKGLDSGVVSQISGYKQEPEWMQKFRHTSLDVFYRKPLPSWGGNLRDINFDDIYYYIRPTDKKVSSWDELPAEIKDTYDKIGIPEAEKKFLSGVSAQYECLTGDALVFGESGVICLKDITAGMIVYALNEQTRLLVKQKVLGVSKKGKRPIFLIRVAGRTLRCTINHPFLTLRYNKKPGKQRGNFSTSWEYFNKLHVGDYVAIVKTVPDEGMPYTFHPVSQEKTYIGRNKSASYAVSADWLYNRRQKTLRIPKRSTESLLWLIGLYLGDGYITHVKKNFEREVLSIAIPATELAMRKKVKAVLREVFGYELGDDKDIYRIRIHAFPIIQFLKKLGLTGTAKTKTLPNWVYSLPRSQKLACIGGYIDSDGYLRNGKRNSDVWITSVNKALLESTEMLALSCGLHIGGIYSFTYTPDVTNSSRKSTGYRLLLSGDLSPLIPYSLKVSQGFVPRRYYHTYGSHHKSSITSHMSNHIGFAAVQEIIAAGEEEVYDIEVNGHHNFVANGIVVHNSEVVYKSVQSGLAKKGVVFLDMDSGLREYPDLVKQYFGTIIPPMDNKFAALNSSVWSGGSFVYVPKGVRVELPLQAYFRINAANMGQFERTLIIAEEGSFVHYVEGCTAPVYTTDSLHSAVVEIIVKKGARVRYTTIQNWSNNVYNLVTKRARVEEEGIMEWVDCNLGCLSADTKIFVHNHGAVSIADVKRADWVYGIDLITMLPIKQKVIAVKPTGKKLLYSLVTQNYREIKATANHPFLTITKKKGSQVYTLSWKNLADLARNDIIAISNGLPDEGEKKIIMYSYPSVKGKALKRYVRIPKMSSPELLWILGAYLGDGFMEKSKTGRARRVYFAIPPKDRARKKLLQVLHELFVASWKPKGISVTVNSALFGDFILSLGFDGTAKEKRIPQWIWSLPLSEKLSFIEGYLDTDGYIRKEKRVDGTIFGQIVFTSSNRTLLEQLKLLMISCGLNPLKIVTYSKGRKLYKGREKLYTSHYLSLNIRDNESLIRDKVFPKMGVQFVPIRSITLLGKEVVYDLETEKTENFIANGIVVHNSKLTMKYPSVYLVGRKARGEILSIAYAGPHQHQDAGGKVIHAAPETTSQIISKSVSRGGGRTSYRGLVQINRGAIKAKSNVVCDALLLDEASRSDTYPTMQVDEQDAQLGHEATVSKIGDEQLFYLETRGIEKSKAESMIVNGFIEPIVKELPLEYAVEMNRLIALQMQGSVG